LKLENFRQHRESEITFRDGMTAIVGPNGCGKSTLLEAISYALYGTKAVRKGQDTIRFYWAETNRFRVELELELDGHRWRIERTGSNAKLSEWLGEQFVERAAGITAVGPRIEKLLRLSRQQFNNSFCAEQKALTFLNFDKPGEAQREVARMLGIDQLQTAAELARVRRLEAKNSADGLARGLGDPAMIKAELATLQSSRKAQAELLATHTRDLDQAIASQGVTAANRDIAQRWLDLSVEIESLSQRAKVIIPFEQQAQAKLKEAQSHVIESQALTQFAITYKERQKELGTLEGIAMAAAEFNGLVNLVAKQLEQERALEGEIGALVVPNVASLNEDLAKALSEANSAQQSLKQSEAEWLASKSEAQSELSIVRSLLASAQTSLEKARSNADKGLCPECEQPTTGELFETILQRRRLEVDLQTASVAKAEAALRAVTDVPKSLDLKRKECEDAEARAVNLQKTLQVANQVAHERKVKEVQLQQLRADREANQAKLKLERPPYDEAAHAELKATQAAAEPAYKRYLVLQVKIEELSKIESEAAAAAKELAEAKARNTELREQRKSLGLADEVSARAAIQAYHDLNLRISTLSSQVTHTRETITSLDAQLEAVRIRLEQHAEKEAELQTLRDAVVLHELIQREMLNLREKLNGQMLPDLQARASQNLAELTSGRYSSLTLDENFAATIVDDNQSKKVISGGEEDVLALALRLAISEMIQEMQGRPFSLLILDEVFGSLDPDRRQAVLDRLGALKGKFAQILVISHIEEINQVADHTIYLRRDPSTKSAVVRETSEASFAL
jgi:exonuclease SbcC